MLDDPAAQGVAHAEPSLSPGDYARQGLETPGLLEAVLPGAEHARARPSITSGLLVDLVCDHGPGEGSDGARPWSSACGTAGAR